MHSAASRFGSDASLPIAAREIVSRRVVAGLWDVDDRSTAALMDDMYARLAAGAPPAVALREAKRALMRAGYPRPYYWAPFQIFTVAL